MAVDKELLELDLYELLGVGEKAPVKEIKTAYRQKALTCHPDKHPGNPKAAELFHQLSQALAVLTDAATRAAYDKVRESKKWAAERTQKLVDRRKKIKLDLEARERQAQAEVSKQEEIRITRTLEEEILRLREEGARQVEEQQRRMQEQIQLETLQRVRGKRDRYGEEGKGTSKLSLRWKCKKEDEAKGGYSKEVLLQILQPSFWKPNEDGREEVQSFSSLKSHTRGSATSGFRKPSYDTEDIPGSQSFRTPDDSTEDIPRWRRAQPKESDGKVTRDEKPFTAETGALDEKLSKTEMAFASRENNAGGKKEEITEDAVEKQEPPHSRSPYSGSAAEVDTPRILSEEEMNRLGAKIVKAELMGNTDLAAKIQTQLDNARKLKESRAQIPTKKSEEETPVPQEDYNVVLVRTDKSGRSWPVNTPGEPVEPKGGRRKRQTVTTHIDKERVRYFQDDDNLSLKDLVRNEKMRTVEDQNKLFMRMASKFTDKTDREYYTLDDMFVSNAAKGERSGEEEALQRRRAIQEHRQLAACLEKCPHCFSSPELPKHLIVAIGNKVYLSLPNYQSLTEGHCLIVPMQHFTAAPLLDEDVWEEIQAFRKTLVKMFEAEELDCVFLDMNLNTKKRYHMVYECIPLPREVGDMAPIYFKKAIMECDEEWSMNKKLIDLSSKDVRKCVPKGLPYFSVDFGLQAGFAHVIEDQHKFPPYFGKEIIGGMLDLEPRLWHKGLHENFEDQRKKVLIFAQRWKPYDFTRSKE